MFLNGILWEGKSLEMHKVPDAIWSALRWKAFHFLPLSKHFFCSDCSQTRQPFSNHRHSNYGSKINHFNALHLTSPFVTTRLISRLPKRFDWNGAVSKRIRRQNSSFFDGNFHWWSVKLSTYLSFSVGSWSLNYYTIFNRSSNELISVKINANGLRCHSVWYAKCSTAETVTHWLSSGGETEANRKEKMTWSGWRQMRFSQSSTDWRSIGFVVAWVEVIY